MKTKLFGKTFLLLIYTLSFMGCNDDDNETTEIHHLSFEKDYYERPLVGAKDIMIRGGNRDYAVEIENPSILEVTVDLSSPADMGNLEIHPKQKGETTIKVRDKVANETVDLKIKIVDSYLNLAVANPIKPPYRQEDEFFLINNEDKDFYLYDKEMTLRHTGSYKFFVESNIPYMELTYHEDFEGKKTYKYNLLGTSQTMFYAIKGLLGWDWHAPVESPVTKEISPVGMNATDTETNTVYYFVARTNDMPEHVLD